jgi:hypothetical protein
LFESFAASSRVVFQQLGGPSACVEYQARDSSLTSRLLVTVEDRRVLIVGVGAEDEVQVTPWVQAVIAASARMTEQHPTYEWVAVIGPTPNDHEPGMGLAEPATVGPLKLRPGGVRHDEYVHSSTPSFGTRGVYWSWPVVVEGGASGYNWWAANEAAIRGLNRLCALVSVSCGRPWTVRQAPMQGDAAQITIPEYSPWEKHPGTPDDNVSRTEVSLAAWVGIAWEVVAREPLANDALSAYYEGILIKDEHPSVALLAFVAAVEAVGEKLVALERCMCCKMVKGSGERFRKALRLVVSDEEATALKKKAYGPRSATVHRAQLHGREAVRGAVHLANFFGIEPPYRFEIDTVRQLERASRQLVQWLLKGDIDTE